MLSAEELFAQGRSLSVQLPQRGGLKDYAPDGSWLQKKQTEKFLEDRNDVLAQERVVPLKRLGQGQWKPELREVEITKQSGRFGQTKGHKRDKMYLYPEEALFLMDEGAMEVHYGGVPMSIQQAYSTFLTDDVTIEHYQVFGHLSRLGYVVKRHQGMSDITPYEIKMRIPQSKKKRSKRQQSNSKETVTENSSENNVAKRRKQERNPELSQADISCTEEKLAVISDNEPPKKINDSVSSTDTTHLVDTTSQEIDCVDEVNKRTDASKVEVYTNKTWIENMDKHSSHGNFSHIKYTSWDFSSLCFVDTCDKSVLTFKRPEKRLLPPGIVFDKTEAEFNCSRPKNDTKKPLEMSFNSSSLKFSSTAKNWKEYKIQKDAASSRYEEFHPASHLWNGTVQPLVKPEEAFSTGAVLESLQIIGKDAKPIPYKSTSDAGDSKYKIQYDVFLPSTKQKRTYLVLPDHRVVVTRYSDTVPTLQDIMQMSELCTDGVPLHWAVVDHGNISFFSLNEVSLPVDIPRC